MNLFPGECTLSGPRALNTWPLNPVDSLWFHMGSVVDDRSCLRSCMRVFQFLKDVSFIAIGLWVYGSGVNCCGRLYPFRQGSPNQTLEDGGWGGGGTNKRFMDLALYLWRQRQVWQLKHYTLHVTLCHVVENVQRQARIACVDAYKHTSYTKLLQETGLEPLSIRGRYTVQNI